jgi:hypothetical protein
LERIAPGWEARYEERAPPDPPSGCSRSTGEFAVVLPQPTIWIVRCANISPLTILGK